jgi:hypothetical protein
MERVVARISEGEAIVADGVAAQVRIARPPAEAVGWYGYVTFPPGVVPQVGLPYRFETADGRSGDVVFTRSEFDPRRSTEARFRGLGRLR